ncbi:unnamed protein product [Paramecium sonneborni]|uniref:Uncharacterized protein n=1 Tax=Paramecium sonneborni TaxID=65129 RepID=A0A8S1Q292_9CILI|nr:unnamed protein product [Paramecium sonneborni]CAD8109769.1 unnamed protein product [Paramecium sonneborni]
MYLFHLHFTILNIVVQETKIFSKKERAPFRIWSEVYNVEKEDNKFEDKKQRKKNSEFNVELLMFNDFQNQSNLTISQVSNQSQGISEFYQIELSKKEKLKQQIMYNQILKRLVKKSLVKIQIKSVKELDNNLLIVILNLVDLFILQQKLGIIQSKNNLLYNSQNFTY